METVLNSKYSRPKQNVDSALHSIFEKENEAISVQVAANSVVVGTRLLINAETFFVILQAQTPELKNAEGFLLNTSGAVVSTSKYLDGRESPDKRSAKQVQAEVSRHLSALDGFASLVEDYCLKERLAVEVSYLTGISLLEATHLPKILGELTGREIPETTLRAHEFGRLMNFYRTGEPITEPQFVPLLRESLRQSNYPNVDALMALPPRFKDISRIEVSAIGEDLVSHGQMRSAENFFHAAYQQFPEDLEFYRQAARVALKQGRSQGALKHLLEGLSAFSEHTHSTEEIETARKITRRVLQLLHSGEISRSEATSAFESVDLPENFRSKIFGYSFSLAA